MSYNVHTAALCGVKMLLCGRNGNGIPIDLIYVMFL